MNKSFYITTPIYYVNDDPHIGTAYTTILADVLSRYQVQLGNDSFFLTGLDEHGQKVQEAATKRGVSPKDHCDEMSKSFISLWDRLHISNNDFIRTTENRHKIVVEKKLEEGLSEKEIYNYFEDKYGEWILYDPLFNKNTYFLWLLPLLIFLFGGAIIYKKFIKKK